jgi:hypothetical protein
LERGGSFRRVFIWRTWCCREWPPGPHVGQSDLDLHGSVQKGLKQKSRISEGCLKAPAAALAYIFRS